MFLILLVGGVVLLFSLVALVLSSQLRGAARGLKANRERNVEAIRAAGEAGQEAVKVAEKKAHGLLGKLRGASERMKAINERKL